MRRGFTLVELLIVIIIIAVLASIAIPKIVNASRKASESGIRTMLKTFRTATERFKQDTGLYPESADALRSKVAPANGIDSSGTSKAITASDFRGPYVDSAGYNANNWDPSLGTVTFTYMDLPPDVGTWKLSMSGNGLDGTPYSTW